MLKRLQDVFASLKRHVPTVHRTSSRTGQPECEGPYDAGMAEALQIGQVAERTGVGVDTIRHTIKEHVTGDPGTVQK